MLLVFLVRALVAHSREIYETIGLKKMASVIHVLIRPVAQKSIVISRIAAKKSDSRNAR